jgi:hypothetical protein
VAIQIFAQGPADAGQCYIVDRRAWHARLDPFEIGEIVEPGLKNAMRRHCLVEPGLRWKRRHATPGDPGRHAADQLPRQGG